MKGAAATRIVAWGIAITLVALPVVGVMQGWFAAGRWPVTIYPGWLRIGLTFLVPVAFAVTVPAEALASRLTPTTLGLAAGFALVLLLFTLGNSAEVRIRALAACELLLETSSERWQCVVKHFDGLRAASPRDARETTLIPSLMTALSKLGGNTTFDLYFENTGMGRGMAPGGMGGGENILITRFMASDRCRALYEEKLRLVYQEAFVSGAMTETIGKYSALIHSVNDERDLVDIDAYDQAVEKVLNFISQRMEYLESLQVLAP